jgi:phospholipid transport system substrate-binding protein
MLKRIFLLLVVGITMATATIVSAEASPTEAIRTSVESILDVLRDKELDRDTRRNKIRDVINTRFDFRAMSQRTLATNWKKASDDEQQQFVELFSLLIESTYIGRVEAYTNEKVDYPGEKVKGKKALVETLILTDSADIPVNYKVYLKNGKWWIYDVVIEGISLISNYRSSYQEIVKKEGFDGLLVKMQEKIKELKSVPS